MNYEGLRRRGFSPERLSAVKAMHKALYRSNLTVEQAMAQIDQLVRQYPAAQPDVDLMSGFLQGLSTHRGIVR